MKVIVFCLLLTGCAAGVIARPDGTRVSGLAVGGASLECCEPDGKIAPSTAEKDGSVNGSCARLTGGALSESMAGLLGAAVSGAVLYFSGGL